VVIGLRWARSLPPSLKVMPHDTKGDSGVGRSGFAAPRLRLDLEDGWRHPFLGLRPRAPVWGVAFASLRRVRRISPPVACDCSDEEIVAMALRALAMGRLAIRSPRRAAWQPAVNFVDRP